MTEELFHGITVGIWMVMVGVTVVVFRHRRG